MRLFNPVQRTLRVTGAPPRTSGVSREIRRPRAPAAPRSRVSAGHTVGSFKARIVHPGVTVVIGNRTHLFDRETRAVVVKVLDEQLVISPR